MPIDVLTQIDELHAIAKAMIKNDKEDAEIVSELMTHGVEAAYAEMIIDNVRKDNRDRTDSYKLFFMGSFFIIGGLIINFFSYQMAVRSNSISFYLFWGIVVMGVIFLIRGFSLYRK